MRTYPEIRLFSYTQAYVLRTYFHYTRTYALGAYVKYHTYPARTRTIRTPYVRVRRAVRDFFPIRTPYVPVRRAARDFFSSTEEMRELRTYSTTPYVPVRTYLPVACPVAIRKFRGVCAQKSSEIMPADKSMVEFELLAVQASAISSNKGNLFQLA